MIIRKELDVASVLASERGERGLSQGKFGKLVGVDQQLVSLYERGLQAPSMKVFLRTMHRLGYDVTLTRRSDR